MVACPTVKVACKASESGYSVINKSDFDPAVHLLFVEGATLPPDAQQKSGTKMRWAIAGKTPKGEVVYWSGEFFSEVSRAYLYSTAASASGSLSRSRAIKGLVEAEGIVDLGPVSIAVEED